MQQCCLINMASGNIDEEIKFKFKNQEATDAVNKFISVLISIYALSIHVTYSPSQSREIFSLKIPVQWFNYCRVSIVLCISCPVMSKFYTINPNPGSYINWLCCVARSPLWPPRQPIGEREALHHSCHGCSRKLLAFTLKELETMRVDQKLLGALTTGGGSAWAGGGGGGRQRSQIRPQAARNVWKRQKNGQFPTLIDLKIAQNTIFT